MLKSIRASLSTSRPSNDGTSMDDGASSILTCAPTTHDDPSSVLNTSTASWRPYSTGVLAIPSA